jgi:hypothetical protein
MTRKIPLTSMKKLITAIGFVASLLGAYRAFADTSVPPPCLSGICIGQPFAEIAANRHWVGDLPGFPVFNPWFRADKHEYELIPIKDPVRAELNAPNVATMDSRSALIRGPKGAELMQRAQFCGAYWFELHTLDEHGWPMALRVIPVVDPDGQVVLRVYSLQKLLSQPLITDEQSGQRQQNFNAQFAAQQANTSPYLAQIGVGKIASLILSYKTPIDMLVGSQNARLRAQAGCAQASSGF